VWTDTTGGPVTAAAALQASQLFVGDSNGDVYSITASNGRSSLTKTYGAAIVGVASTTRFMVIVESDGTVHGSKGVGEGQWQTTLGSAPASAPVILNGGVYVAGSDGRLHLWTIPGNPPA
jgi:outer membrane protein assembly factor BamB